MACLFFAMNTVLVRAEDAIKWKTGSEFTKALREPISRERVELTLNEALHAFSRHAQVAILLDRRVDPQQLVTIEAHNLPLADELKDLARAIQLGVDTVGPVVYFGPTAAVARADALSELRRREAVATGNKAWLATASSSWDELSEPRQLAVAIAKGAGAKLNNPEAIPHDVWPAWSGPTMSHSDRLTLVLAGFDLTFELSADGAEVRVVSAPADLTFERSYDTTGVAATVGGDLKRLLPDIKLQASGANKLRVTATAEQHAQVADLLAGKRTTTKTAVVTGEQVYTFAAENQPYRAMVDLLAKQRGLKVEASEPASEKLKQRGTVMVEKATLDAALKKVLDPIGIKFKVREKTLELSE
jgi:hypothetical protein